MIKCIKFLAIVSIIILKEKVNGKPMDPQEAVIMAAAQVKETFDNGAAASDKKEFEFFGAKIKNEMGVGFGDAARAKRSNHDSKEKKHFNRMKRFANIENFTEQIINSKEKLIAKRETDVNSIVIENDEDYDYSSSSSSSSSESEEKEKRKRSISLDEFSEDMKNIYLLKN